MTMDGKATTPAPDDASARALLRERDREIRRAITRLATSGETTAERIGLWRELESIYFAMGDPAAAATARGQIDSLEESIGPK